MYQNVGSNIVLMCKWSAVKEVQINADEEQLKKCKLMQMKCS